MLATAFVMLAAFCCIGILSGAGYRMEAEWKTRMRTGREKS